MNPIDEMIKTLDELEIRVKNTEQIRNITTPISPHGHNPRNTLSNNDYTKKFSDYILESITKLKKCLLLYNMQSMRENAKLQTHLIQQYKKYEKQQTKLETCIPNSTPND